MPRTGMPSAAPLIPQLPPCERPCVPSHGLDVVAFEGPHLRRTVLSAHMAAYLWDRLTADEQAGWHAERKGTWVRVYRLVLGPAVHGLLAMAML